MNKKIEDLKKELGQLKLPPRRASAKEVSHYHSTDDASQQKAVTDPSANPYGKTVLSEPEKKQNAPAAELKGNDAVKNNGKEKTIMLNDSDLESEASIETEEEKKDIFLKYFLAHQQVLIATVRQPDNMKVLEEKGVANVLIELRLENGKFSIVTIDTGNGKMDKFLRPILEEKLRTMKKGPMYSNPYNRQIQIPISYDAQKLKKSENHPDMEKEDISGYNALRIEFGWPYPVPSKEEAYVFYNLVEEKIEKYMISLKEDDAVSYTFNIGKLEDDGKMSCLNPLGVNKAQIEGEESHNLPDHKFRIVFSQMENQRALMVLPFDLLEEMKSATPIVPVEPIGYGHEIFVGAGLTASAAFVFLLQRMGINLPESVHLNIPFSETIHMAGNTIQMCTAAILGAGAAVFVGRHLSGRNK